MISEMSGGHDHQDQGDGGSDAEVEALKACSYM